jgi:hypothetical protein
VRDVVAHLEDLRNGLVAEGERALERCQPHDDGTVEVAGRRHDRLNDRVIIGLQHGHRSVDIAQLAPLDVLEPLHELPSSGLG